MMVMMMMMMKPTSPFIFWAVKSFKNMMPGLGPFVPCPKSGGSAGMDEVSGQCNGVSCSCRIPIFSETLTVIVNGAAWDEVVTFWGSDAALKDALHSAAIITSKTKNPYIIESNHSLNHKTRQDHPTCGLISCWWKYRAQLKRIKIKHWRYSLIAHPHRHPPPTLL